MPPSKIKFGCKYADGQLKIQKEAESMGLSKEDTLFESVPQLCGKNIDCSECPHHYGGEANENK
jgi:hypothetical protein